MSYKRREPVQNLKNSVKQMHICVLYIFLKCKYSEIDSVYYMC